MIVSGCSFGDCGASPSASPGPPAAEVLPSPSPSPEPSPTPLPSPSPSPYEFPPYLPVSWIQIDYGFVHARSSPGAFCTLSGAYPDSRAIEGLGTKTADSKGDVVWTYAQSPKDATGTGSYSIVCTLNGLTATNSAPFELGD
jgi:hypothetical protein